MSELLSLALAEAARIYTPTGTMTFILAEIEESTRPLKPLR